MYLGTRLRGAQCARAFSMPIRSGDAGSERSPSYVPEPGTWFLASYVPLGSLWIVQPSPAPLPLRGFAEGRRHCLGALQLHPDPGTPTAYP